jgi:predicted nucleotidyltransferase
MCSQQTLHEILGRLCGSLRELFGASMKDVILFGSYARNEASDESDIDIMILSDMERADISALQWKIGEAVSDILLEYGVMVSPIVENRAFFLENQEIMPFFRNIHQEGVRISA